MTDTLSTGVDAEASVRTVPALHANFLLKATFLGILMRTSLLKTALTTLFLITNEALKSALHMKPQAWQINSACDGRLSL